MPDVIFGEYVSPGLPVGSRYVKGIQLLLFVEKTDHFVRIYEMHALMSGTMFNLVWKPQVLGFFLGIQIVHSEGEGRGARL